MLTLTKEERDLLGKLAASRSGEIVIDGNVRHSQYDRIKDAGYVKTAAGNLSAVIYTITDEGRAAFKKGEPKH